MSQNEVEFLATPAIVVQPRSGIKASIPATDGAAARASVTDISSRCIGRLR